MKQVDISELDIQQMDRWASTFIEFVKKPHDNNILQVEQVDFNSDKENDRPIL
ncbi:MAG: hypothetical protein ACTHZG_04955 [Ruoffia tabacinasalis]|uniref:hypothetical protein n=1 Tax=unclassified Ruoffia TaxID=2862149 RepID=UPI0038882881